MADDNFTLGTGAATFRPVAYFTSQQGGMSLMLANRDDADELEYRVESAAGPGRGLQTADWRAADEVQTGVVAPGAVAKIHDVADAEDFRQFRLLVRGAGVKFVALFGEPTGAAETETEVGGPGIEVTFDPDTEVLTVTSIEGFLDFDQVAEVWFVNDIESPYGIEVFDDPGESLNGFIRVSSDVITLDYAAPVWMGPYDAGDPGTLSQLSFYSVVGGNPEDLVGQWDGEVDMSWPPRQAVVIDVTYDDQDDILTVVMTDPEADIDSIVRSITFFFDDEASVTPFVENSPPITVVGDTFTWPGFATLYNQNLTRSIAEARALDAQSRIRGTWTGSLALKLVP